MFEDTDLILQVATAEPKSTAGAIRIQGGTNGHELDPDGSGFRRCGDTNGSGARTFIKLDSEHGDSDIRIKLWMQDGKVHEFEMVEAVSVAVGGGEEARTMAAGIRMLAALFAELDLESASPVRSTQVMNDVESSRIES